jgi:hypothetical protein
MLSQHSDNKDYWPPQGGGDSERRGARRVGDGVKWVGGSARLLQSTNMLFETQIESTRRRYTARRTTKC